MQLTQDQINDLKKDCEGLLAEVLEWRAEVMESNVASLKRKASRLRGQQPQAVAG